MFKFTNDFRPKSGPLDSEILIAFKYSPLAWKKIMVKILKKQN